MQEFESLVDLSVELEEETGKRPWIPELLKRLAEHNYWSWEHSVRVAAVELALCRYLELPSDERHLLVLSGLVHDIGKLAVPTILLDSTFRLTPPEWAQLTIHPREGFNLLKENDPEIARIIVAHHEFQDKPYPRSNPRNTDLPELRYHQSLVALADQVDALLSPRPHRETAWTQEEAGGLLSRRFSGVLVGVAIESRMKIGH